MKKPSYIDEEWGATPVREKTKDPLGIAPYSKDLEDRENRPEPDKIYTGSIDHDILYKKS